MHIVICNLIEDRAQLTMNASHTCILLVVYHDDVALWTILLISHPCESVYFGGNGGWIAFGNCFKTLTHLHWAMVILYSDRGKALIGKAMWVVMHCWLRIFCHSF